MPPLPPPSSSSSSSSSSFSNDRYITRGLGKYCDELITGTYPWPSCATHLKQVVDYHDWYSWVCDSQHSPHGYVHVWIGGMLNCDDTINTLTDLVGKDNADAIKKSAMNRKSYWQKGMFECKGSADADTTVEEVRVFVVLFSIDRANRLTNKKASVVAGEEKHVCMCVPV